MGDPPGIGVWYEFLIYELALEFATTSSYVRYVVAKGFDVHKPPSEVVNISSSDGLFYDYDKRIAIRGDYRSLGEYDLILFDSFGDIVYCEVKKSRKYIKEQKYKFHYKKRLLEELFGCQIYFLIICGEKLGHNQNVKDVLEETRGDYVYLRIPPNSELFSSYHSSNNIFEIERPVAKNSKLGYWSEFETLKKLNYSENHEQLRKFLISLVNIKEPLGIIKRRIESSLIERVFLGKLADVAIDKFLHIIKIDIDGKQLNFKGFRENYAEIILALTIPRLKPIIYLKKATKDLYLNTELEGEVFTYKNKKETPGTGFYNAIANTQETISDVIAISILKTVTQLDNKREEK